MMIAIFIRPVTMIQKETWKTKNEKVWIGGQEAELTLGFGKRRRQLQPLTNPTKICNN